MRPLANTVRKTEEEKKKQKTGSPQKFLICGTKEENWERKDSNRKDQRNIKKWTTVSRDAWKGNRKLDHHHQSLNSEGRWGTTDDFATSFLHFFLFSTAFWDSPNSRPVHRMMLSSHLFLCPPCLLPLFTVSCKMVLARSDERETWPYHCSLRLFTSVRRSSCGPIACWILAWTSS